MTAELAVAQADAPAMLERWAQAASAAHRLVAPLVNTEFLPVHFRPKSNSEQAVAQAQASATAAVLTGAELGLTPMQSLQGIIVVSGRPGMYARTMLAIVLAAGHEVWTEESTDARAIVCGQRANGRHEERVVVTMDQARKAGWTSNAQYSRQPATMLLARAQAQVCRRVAPDALAGIGASVEELRDEERSEMSTPVSRATAGTGPKRTARRTEPAVVEEPALDEPASTDGAEPQLALEAPAEVGPMTPEQSRELQAALTWIGMTDKDTALAYIGGVVEREVGATRDLTAVEAVRVIAELNADAADRPAVLIDAAEVEDHLSEGDS